MNEKKICPSCGYQNEDVATVCSKCGRLLEYKAKRKDYRPILTLAGLLTIIIVVFLSGYLILESEYHKAITYYDYGDYEAAANVLTKISFYKNSKDLLNSSEMSNEMGYRDAVKSYEKKNYLSALVWFANNSYYADSSNYLVSCAKGYLSGKWDSTDYNFEFNPNQIVIKNKAEIKAGYGGTERYRISEYEVCRADNDELVIQIELESDDEIAGYLCFIDLRTNEFECENNGHFTRK